MTQKIQILPGVLEKLLTFVDEFIAIDVNLFDSAVIVDKVAGNFVAVIFVVVDILVVVVLAGRVVVVVLDAEFLSDKIQ